ncbi:MAG: hypothetical protein IJ569_02790 [Prevotella sp.]|nr:hypothetical protein [Prevotella sp.]
MTILYLTFGDKTEFHVQAYLSMMSFRRQMAEGDRLVMVTTAPQFYRHLSSWAEVITIDDRQIETWQGKHHFFWRAKIKAIEHVSQKYPDDDILYLDCDTILYGDIHDLKRPLSEGRGLMDENEGHPSKMKTKTLRMWKTVAGRQYDGITLGAQHNMYRAGVVGIPHTKAPEVLTTALVLCDGMLDDGAERIVIEQYSLSVALFEKTKLQETYRTIAHYWASKDYWVKAGMELMSCVLLTDASPEEEMKMYESLDFSRLPIYIYKSNTARRLKNLIGKAFPDRDFRYIEKE